VWLERDISQTDRFDRLLRYDWLGDDMVNAILVRDG
jgi:endonuclease YncB( thermonuclease family)